MPTPHPSKRKLAYVARPERRKALYPPDDELIELVDHTNVTLAAAMLGVTQQALSYYLLGSGLITRTLFYRRRHFNRSKKEQRLRERAAKIAASVYDE